jgi:hypothetical protein
MALAWAAIKPDADTLAAGGGVALAALIRYLVDRRTSACAERIGRAARRIQLVHQPRKRA